MPDSPWLDGPVFCLTADTDWASDWAIADLLGLAGEYGIRPTLFATHRSPAILAFANEHPQDLGLHPNFLPDSTHGAGESDVVEHLRGLFPKAETYRAHCFFDHTRLQRRFWDFGFRYDSNLCLFLQPQLVPLRLSSGLVRFPVFWEDDVHWAWNNGDWSLDTFLPHFLTPGLKILNVHPFFIAANLPGEKYYVSVKSHIETLSEESCRAIRWASPGARSFLETLLDHLTQNKAHFLTLRELYFCDRGSEPC